MVIKKKLAGFVQTVFPATRAELLLFVIFLTVYGTFGTYIALNYRIIFDDRIPWDAYFSFDNRAIVLTGGGYERHPLANYFFGWLREFVYLFSDGKKNDVFRLVLAWCSNITISLSLIQVYKYLKNIIGLPNKISVLLIFFFVCFSTNILLSFTPETYTYTLFFLILFNYYAALKLKKDQKIPAVPLTLAAISVGGLTITNIVKVYIPLLFEKDIFWNWRKIGNTMLRILASAAVFLLLFLYRVDFKFLSFLNKSGEQFEKFSKPKVIPVWDMVSSWFLGGNILLAGFEIRDYHNRKGFEYKALFMEVYNSWVPYLFVLAVVLLIFWSYVKNFKRRFVQILMLSFLVDIAIHVIFRFGLHTSYIYGGHFVFVFPLMLGWLFYAYRNAAKTLSVLYYSVLVLFFYLLLNNIFRISEFFTFLEAYYR